METVEGADTRQGAAVVCVTPGRSARGTQVPSAAAPELCLWWLHGFLDSMYIVNATCERNYTLTEACLHWTADLICCQCRPSSLEEIIW